MSSVSYPELTGPMAGLESWLSSQLSEIPELVSKARQTLQYPLDKYGHPEGLGSRVLRFQCPGNTLSLKLPITILGLAQALGMVDYPQIAYKGKAAEKYQIRGVILKTSPEQTDVQSNQQGENIQIDPQGTKPNQTGFSGHIKPDSYYVYLRGDTPCRWGRIQMYVPSNKGNEVLPTLAFTAFKGNTFVDSCPLVARLKDELQCEPIIEARFALLLAEAVTREVLIGQNGSNLIVPKNWSRANNVRLTGRPAHPCSNFH
ncbi:hypothetical protein HY025_04085 [Candidatus Daviesbacteria bacterium]|nr:hypothetical protein [Candidatus Daviesbacteria bacterium]